MQPTPEMILPLLLAALTKQYGEDGTVTISTEEVNALSQSKLNIQVDGAMENITLSLSEPETPPSSLILPKSGLVLPDGVDRG